QEEIPRLTLDVEVLARRDAPIFTLAPVPERARLLGVGENQQILVILLRNLTPDRTARRCVRNLTVLRRDLEHLDPRQIGHFLTHIAPAIHLKGLRPAAGR